jgi:hypothetical protein
MSAVKRKWKDDQENEEGQENQLSNKKMKNTVIDNDQVKETEKAQEKSQEINTKQDCAAYALSIIAPHYSPSQIGVLPLLGYLDEKVPVIHTCTGSQCKLMCWKENKEIQNKKSMYKEGIYLYSWQAIHKRSRPYY